MTIRLTRRGAIGAGLGVPLVVACSEQQAAAPPPASGSVFIHGVASGDPRSDSLVLWTRVETTADREPVRWELALDPEFAQVIGAGEATALAEADHTVKALPGGLKPDVTYYYRFIARDQTSPVGRARTLPVGPTERIGIALASCSNYAFGFFNAYDAIAKDEAIQFVLHTGDYIYEYGADGWGAETAQTIDRVHVPANEIVSLSDYRLRHAQYKRDAGSLAMHAAHPLIVLWDDHESANNPWTGGAQNHQPDTEGDWLVRRTNAIQAYYEWMPIREPEAGRSREEFWRTYVFGDLATLVTMETRHTARGEQVDYLKWVGRVTDPVAMQELKTLIADPSRTMISPAQADEVKLALSASVAAGQPWRIIGNAIPMARMIVPDVVKMGILPPPMTTTHQASQMVGLLGALGLPAFTDTWDGYPAAREAFYALCREAGASDLLVLTGDSHSFWMNQLADGQGRSMGVELGTAGISSPGDFIESGFDPETAAKLDRALETLDEVVWTDNFHQGYVRVVLGRDGGAADFVVVDSVLTPDYGVSTLKSTKLVPGGGALAFADA
jgi:alkaline phosphatase D